MNTQNWYQNSKGIEQEAGMKENARSGILALLMALMGTPSSPGMPKDQAIQETSKRTGTPIAEVQQIANQSQSQSQYNTDDKLASAIASLSNGKSQRVMTAITSVLFNRAQRMGNDWEAVANNGLVSQNARGEQGESFQQAKNILSQVKLGKIPDVTGGALAFTFDKNQPKGSNKWELTTTIDGVNFWIIR